MNDYYLPFGANCWSYFLTSDINNSINNDLYFGRGGFAKTNHMCVLNILNNFLQNYLDNNLHPETWSIHEIPGSNNSYNVHMYGNVRFLRHREEYTSKKWNTVDFNYKKITNYLSLRITNKFVYLANWLEDDFEIPRLQKLLSKVYKTNAHLYFIGFNDVIKDNEFIHIYKLQKEIEYHRNENCLSFYKDDYNNIEKLFNKSLITTRKRFV